MKSRMGFSPNDENVYSYTDHGKKTIKNILNFQLQSHCKETNY